MSHSQFTWFILNSIIESEPTEPVAPLYGPAPVIQATEDGFAIVPERPDSEEINKVGQAALFSAIQRRIEALEPTVARLSNSFPGLVAEYKNYRTVFGSNLVELDIPTLWAAGAGVAEFLRTLEAQAISSSLTEILDPEALAGFRALVGDHTSFILGFSFAREMLSRAQAMHALDETFGATKAHTHSLLSSIDNQQGLMSVGASTLIRSLDRALGAAEYSGTALVSVSYETGRNCLIAFGETVNRLAASQIVKVVALSDALVQISGLEHIELLHTAVDYLWENEALILTFASSSPQLTVWLSWLIEQIVMPLRKD